MPPPPSLVVAEVGYELSLWQGLGLWEDRVLGCWRLVCKGLVPCSDVSPGGASPPLDGPDGAFRTGQKPGCWLSPDPVTCHHIALHVLSPTDILLVLSAARGVGALWSTQRAFSITPSGLTVFSLPHLTVPGLSLLPRQPRGFLVVPLRGNLSSGCWDSQKRR